MIEVGNYVEFGRWFFCSNKIMSIEWRVLSIVDGVAFLISRFGLDVMRFDGKNNEWESSEIRQWLNGEFKNKAFSDKELTALDGEIVVPSWPEVKSLIPNTGFVRKCSPTPWAKARGAFTDRGRCVWWTRTASEEYRRFACVISADGGCHTEDCRTGNFCVRPCIRVKVEALRDDEQI